MSLAAFAMNMSSEPICIMAASKGLIVVLARIGYISNYLHGLHFSV